LVKVAPSILSADFRNLEAEIKKVEAAGADLIHIDVMDGHFVPNITIGPLVVSACRKTTKLPLDVHLMIENPDRYIEAFARAGADIITVQVEASTNIKRDIELIKKFNIAPGLAINPKTPADKVLPFLDKIALVLIMSVNPGFEAQKFMPEVLPKAQILKSEIIKRKLNVEIEIDGGINLETASEAVRAGVDILVAGSAIFYAKDRNQVICGLKKI